MNENLFLYIGFVFLLAAAGEYFSGVALHSAIFSNFTGAHTIVTGKKEPEKFKTAVVFHSIVGIFFIIVDFVFA